MSKVSSVGMKENARREGRRKIKFHDSEAAEFFTTKISTGVFCCKFLLGFSVILWIRFGISGKNMPSWNDKGSRFERIWYKSERHHQQRVCLSMVKD